VLGEKTFRQSSILTLLSRIQGLHQYEYSLLCDMLLS
jgi:hypothetical protein